MELFEEQVKKQPSAVALVPEGALELTYADVNQAAEAAATQLLGVGASGDSGAALILHRSVAKAVSIYGLLTAGAAYGPSMLTRLHLASSSSSRRQGQSRDCSGEQREQAHRVRHGIAHVHLGHHGKAQEHHRQPHPPDA